MGAGEESRGGGETGRLGILEGRLAEAGAGEESI